MIGPQLVGAIVRGDLAGYRLDADDARLIVRQRVATPVQALLQSHPGVADAEAVEILDRAVRRATLASMLQVATSNRIAEILDQAGVRALIYKGVALRQSGGGSWRGRESVDVDVVIDGSDLVRAHEAITAAGLSRVDGKDVAPTALSRLVQIEMAYQGLPTTVDLHWRLESRGYLDIPFDRLWDERRRVDADGMAVWTLGAADSVLVSAVHGTREEWRSLRHMLDASTQLAGMPQDEWLEVVEASRCGATKSLAVALAVADACGTIGLPAIPGTWAMTMAQDFLDDWSERASGAKPRLALSPRDALRRRTIRWRLAPSSLAAADGLARAGLRQVTQKRSWKVRHPQ